MILRLLKWVLLTSLVLIAGVFVAIGILQQPINGPGLAANDNMRIYDPAFTEPTTRVGDAMEGYRAALESPSVSVAVGVHRKLVFSAACGYADIETRTLATTETVYAIGSVSKPITAALTVALWEDGVLNLDMNVREYVPDPDRIEALARANPAAASGAALEEAATFQPVAPARRLAQLAALLAEDGGCDIGQLAARCGVTAKHASRACKRWFGEPPVRLRQEGRPRRAIALLLDGASPVEAALDAGFSDQPHLTRLLKQATGFTPARLVRS